MVKSFFSALKKRLAAIYKKKYFSILTGLSILLLAGTIVLPLWRLFPAITEQVAVPLHYNIHFGVDAFGHWQRIFTVPVIAVIIFFVNLLITLLYWKKDKVVSYFATAVMLFGEILLFLAMIHIVSLNLTYYG